MDVRVVADAIATRFTGATTSAGETFASAPTASLPNTLNKGPVCLVFHPAGVLDVGVSRLRLDVLDYPVRILMDPLSVPARSDALYRWYNATRDLVEGDIDLSLAYVAWARPVQTRVELDGFTYGMTEQLTPRFFDVVEYIVRVRFNEVVSTIA